MAIPKKPVTKKVDPSNTDEDDDDSTIDQPSKKDDDDDDFDGPLDDLGLETYDDFDDEDDF